MWLWSSACRQFLATGVSFLLLYSTWASDWCCGIWLVVAGCVVAIAGSLTAGGRRLQLFISLKECLSWRKTGGISICRFIVFLSTLYHAFLNSRACFVFAWSKCCVLVQLIVCLLLCVCAAGSDRKWFVQCNVVRSFYKLSSKFRFVLQGSCFVFVLRKVCSKFCVGLWAMSMLKGRSNIVLSSFPPCPLTRVSVVGLLFLSEVVGLLLCLVGTLLIKGTG